MKNNNYRPFRLRILSCSVYRADQSSRLYTVYECSLAIVALRHAGREGRPGLRSAAAAAAVTFFCGVHLILGGGKGKGGGGAMGIQRRITPPPLLPLLKSRNEPHGRYFWYKLEQVLCSHKKQNKNVSKTAVSPKGHASARTIHADEACVNQRSTYSHIRNKTPKKIKKAPAFCC